MASVSIFVGSMYGNADNLAAEVKNKLISLGHDATVFEDGNIEQLKSADNVLFITSTTGSGDLPDNIQPLFQQMQSQFPMLTSKKVGVIGLGDSSYGETFCGAGQQVDALVKELNATIPVERLDIDACEHFEPWEPAAPWLMLWAAQL
ncbi:flavodoxin [Pseudoalteromonas sp. S16_S37]|uniref:flavodoxin n=1 Tax=Pseudoalteromonas sp. S16_S37 TaxID=2720228 RepID=UPI0016812834|nr:flavodoxin [Pseudoalteromonas sp. S16_S37]MBD1584314.1 flavodoxin [Pseudoalteromonas sp. S16_S37]